MLWLPSVRDAVLIGSPEPLGIDLDRLRAAFAEPRTRANLEAAYLETPEALLATYLLDRSAVEEWTADAPVITDERPLMEFFRHQGGNMTDADIATLLELPQGEWDWVAGLADAGDLLGAVRIENRALRLYVRAAAERNAASREEAARISRGTEFFLYPFGCATRQRAYLEAGVGVSPVEARARLQQCARLRPTAAAAP
jgi:spermidine synthase